MSAVDKTNNEIENTRVNAREKPGFDVKPVIRLVLATVSFMLGIFLNAPAWASVLLLIGSALIAGYDVVLRMVRNILKKSIFTEFLIITLAVIVAFIIGAGHEGAAIVLIYQMGRFLHGLAVDKCSESAYAYNDMHLEMVQRLPRDGAAVSIPASELRPGDMILIRSGERIPVDCILTEGHAVVNVSALTGDEVPKKISEDEKIASGAVNIGGDIKAEVLETTGKSTLARIISTINSIPGKGKTEKAVYDFARIYVPVLIAIGLLAAVLIPIFTDITIKDAVYRSLAVLAVACTGAYTVSVPVSYLAGMGKASRLGILFKSSEAMDEMSRAGIAAFDVPGTLTLGNYRVSAVRSEKMDADMLLKIAAHAEAHSNHPIAKSILSAYGKEVYIELIESFTEYPGEGVRVRVDGMEILLGSFTFLKRNGVDSGSDALKSEKAVYMSIGGRYAGRIVLTDQIKSDSSSAVHELEKTIGSIALISGDNNVLTERLAKSVGINEYYSDCIAADKVLRVRELKKKAGKRSVILVAEKADADKALAEADVGVAMNGLYPNTAVSASDVVILDDKPVKVAGAVYLAKAVKGIVIQNFCGALGLKLIILILGLLGIFPVWLIVFMDLAATLLEMLNAMSVDRRKSWAIAAK